MLQRNNKFYSDAIEKFGVTPQGVHWKNHYSQLRRFEVITSFIENIQESSIVDAGCGFGDYYLYLHQSNKIPKKYIGLDCEKKMINLAKIHCEAPFFFQVNILEDTLFEADYYIASGTLNILDIDEVELFIKRGYGYSKKGFIFNCLKGLTFNKISKVEIISICRNYCESSKIRILEGYLDNDFTLFMSK